MIPRNFTLFPTLTTERPTLRQLSIDDQQHIFALRSDAEINKYLDRLPVQTIEEAINFINKVTDNIKKNNSLYWAITLTKTNTFVGTICLFSFSDENNKCEIGYELLTTFQGKGIMKEAVESVIHYAFNTMKVQIIEAVCHRNNQHSIKLLDRFCFKNSNKQDIPASGLITYLLTNSIQDYK